MLNLERGECSPNTAPGPTAADHGAPADRHRKVRVALLDDHRAYVEALALALNTTHDLKCVGISNATETCLTMAMSKRPDAIVLDYRLVDGDGLDCARRLQEAGVTSRLVMVSGHASADLDAVARAAGIKWFLSKATHLNDLLMVIRAAAANRPQMTAFVGHARINMSPRQRETLALLGAGHGPAKIADLLSVSIHTARGYVKDILRLMGASSQLEAVSIAIRRGYLIPPGIEQDCRAIIDLAG